MLKGVYF